ncbi:MULTISPECIES: type II toxin-antitoxin system RelB/DinJ family antitoxin [unclassified Treponema]|uniref:type II toxin-antitoxin system RelB/DinJ family antitoxin n=1 Tax=unclassified Treponema TaxID=2638727 RepID=UPI0025FF0BA8|nr:MULTISPECIES: type II toxin-antitoxin system RelB/DinJ family antitoxin [unclassified Treponema]
MNTVAMNVRVDKELKEQATELYNDLGLSLSSAINMFLRQSVRENGLPFKPQRTRRKSEIELASEEADQIMNDPDAKTYDNFQEILDELGIDA